MKFFKAVLYWVVQCTWGIIQTLLGLGMFLKYANCKHEFYHGSVLTYHSGEWGGVSLGLFIFVNGTRGNEWQQDTKVHEYGHTIQSLILGPLYMFVIGIPSMIWCNCKRFEKMRERGEKTYFDFYPESGANKLGSWATKEPIPLWEHNLAEVARQKALKARNEQSNKTK